MSRSHLASLIAIILIFLLSFYAVVPSELNISGKQFNIPKPELLLRKDNFSFGLDLAGGSQLIFLVDTSGVESENIDDGIDSLKEVMERRVNLFGVSEPNIQTFEYGDERKILIELPGVYNTQDAVDLIGQTAQLQFAEVIDEEQPQEDGDNEDGLEVKQEPPFEFTDLTGADITKASVIFDPQSGKPTVQITFTDEGKEKFGEITGRNVGKALPIFLDNNVVSAPIVQQQITSNEAVITGDFSLDDAKELSIQLNAGALPLSVEMVEQRTIGPTLGQESINKSLVAGAVGLAAVVLFMILVYGRLGLVASLGLFVFAIITLAIYKIIPITLTLPGIAGFVLAVGMAVDSNILIFERFKEERPNREVADALESAFGRAWDSIRDANVATLITAFILANPLDWSFLHVSGPVRGFAITLALGIVVSIFTGVFVSRNLLRLFVRK